MENDAFHIHDLSVFVLFFHLSGFYLIYLYYYWKCMFLKDTKVPHTDACFNAYVLSFLNESVRYWLSDYTVSVWVLCLLNMIHLSVWHSNNHMLINIISQKIASRNYTCCPTHINYISFLFHFIKDRNKEPVIKIPANASTFILS